jgi:putative colanic acid biosynthesis UDP-glucose lipid carrier transferase
MFFIIVDLFILNIIYLLSESFFEESAESKYYYRYFQFWVVLNWFWITLVFLGGVYQAKYILYFEKFLQRSMRLFGVWVVLVLVYLFLPRRIPLSQPLVYTTIGLAFLGILFNRFLYLGIREWVKRTVYLNRKILILGHNPLAHKLASYLDGEEFNIKIMGFLDDKNSPAKNNGYPVYSNLDDTLKISRQLRVNEIYSTIMPENNAKVYKIMEQAEKELIRFKVVADFTQFIDKPVYVDFLRDIPVLAIRREPMEEVLNRFNKRVFDLAVSGFVIVFILSWLVPILGLLIYLESPGPIFFAQIRSGKNNKPFRCYKFRSMRPNKEANSTQATRNDNRVTRIGRIIRKTSLDEFPQFVNVLKGEMSIVGPRPHMLKHTKGFSLMEDQYMVRQFLKPGITGWAQINGYRGEITELHHIKKRVEYDLWYLENWSPWLDFKIVFLTAYNVFKGEENAF